MSSHEPPVRIHDGVSTKTREPASRLTMASASRFPDPLVAELITATTHAQRLAREDFEVIQSMVAWRTQPPIDEIGRSAWMPLRAPFYVEGPGSPINIGSVKVKGVGLRDHHGTVHQPSHEPYKRSVFHLGLRGNGDLYEAPATPAPMGAITLPRAIAELSTAGELSYRGGHLSEVPLLLYRYLDLPAFNEPSGALAELAVLVTGLPTTFPHRGDRLVSFEGQDEETQATLRHWAAAEAGVHDFEWLLAVSAMWSSYGTMLSEFHRLGYYRHNANPSNLGLGHRGVFFVDLDSTRALLECAPAVRSTQTMRDVAGGLFHIASSTLCSVLPQHFTSSEILAAGWPRDFLASYFPSASAERLDEAVAVTETIFEAMWARQETYGFGRAMFGTDPAPNDYHEFMTSRDRARTRAIDRPALFAELLPAVVDLHQHADHAHQHSAPPSAQAMRDAATAFLRRRT